MSHGDTDDRIYAYDGMFKLETDIVEPIAKNHTLDGKPIIFFIQTCKTSEIMNSDEAKMIESKANIIKCFSSYEGEYG